MDINIRENYTFSNQKQVQIVNGYTVRYYIDKDCFGAIFVKGTRADAISEVSSLIVQNIMQVD